VFELMFVILDCHKCFLAWLFLSVKYHIQMSYVICFMTNNMMMKMMMMMNYSLTC